MSQTAIFKLLINQPLNIISPNYELCSIVKLSSFSVKFIHITHRNQFIEDFNSLYRKYINPESKKLRLFFCGAEALRHMIIVSLEDQVFIEKQLPTELKI
jgi:hypothetical protein